jgi:hypothetical protein
LDFGCKLSTATDDWRHGAIIELKSQTVNANANTGGHPGQNFAFEFGRAVEFVLGYFLDLGVGEVFASLSALSFDNTAQSLRPGHWCVHLHLEVSFGQTCLLMLLKLHSGKLCHFLELV